MKGFGTDSELFNRVVEAAPNAMIMINAEGRIVLLNPQAARLFGYAEDELLGQPIEILVPDRFTGPHPAQRQDYLRDPRTRSMGAGRELFGKKKDGSEVPVEIGLNPLEIDGRTFVLASVIDITERKKNEQLLRSQEAAIEASRIKSQFLATMSHEIRTPLNGIIGLTNLLMAMPMNLEQADYLRGIRTSADSLLSLINDILDFSKIEADKMEFEIEHFSPGQAVADTVSVVASTAKQKGLKLEMGIDPDLPAWFKGDSAKIKQVLLNLIGNAIKFTETGTIKVRVRPPKEDQSSSSLLFEVEDTGLGIDPDVQGKLFEVFTQGDSSTRRKYGGTGLGLSISKRLVNKMGGEIGVHSAAGKGSLFWFHLPLALGEEPAPAKNSETSPRIIPRDLDFRVLVVEDNMINQKVALGTLRNLGLQGQAVGNGLEALRILEDFSFDLILMDCHMPEMDGYETTQKIRRSSNERIRKIPIIAMTANAMRGDEEKCLAVGMNDYMMKPIDPEKFSQVVMKWMDGEVMTLEEETRRAKIKEAMQKVERQYGVRMVRDLAQTYLEEAPKMLGMIESGLGAKDYRMALRESHSLKSSSLILGCQEVADLALEVELACHDERFDGIGERFQRLSTATQAVFPILKTYVLS